MPTARILDAAPVRTLAAHRSACGYDALEAARAVAPDVLITLLTDAGLRGRGGAGFPTGTKWRTVADNAAGSPIAPVVAVNAAEGEPGTFGDRTLLRQNPYRVLEGALIAAWAIGSASVVVVTKDRFTEEVERLVGAASEMEADGCTNGVDIEVVAAPAHYLLGEETGLLEAAAGRPPFPRIAPPYRHGVTEVGDPTGGAGQLDLASEGGDVPPTLVNNVETLAHVPGIVVNGAAWFRELGTAESPGTKVFTVSGDTEFAGVGEFPLGTPVREIVQTLGGDVAGGVGFVLSGVANGLLPAGALDTPATFEAMDAAGSGLGAGGFLVFSTGTDPVAVAHGISRFLAVESCGQCTPCKQDGLAVADLLDLMRRGEAQDDAVEQVVPLLHRVPEGARCDLGRQHERVVMSILEHFGDAAISHAVDKTTAEPVLIAPITHIDDEGLAHLDEQQATKQPDWTHGDTWSGKTPVDIEPAASESR